MKTIAIKYFDFFVGLGAGYLEDGIYEISTDNKLVYISEVRKNQLNGVSKTIVQYDTETEYRISEICFYKDNKVEGECFYMEY